MHTTAPALLTAAYRNPVLRSRLAARFARSDYVRLPRFLSRLAQQATCQEAALIADAGFARDFLMPGYYTRRRMRGIGGKVVRERAPSLVALYENLELRSFLEAVTGQAVFSCRHLSEFLVMNVFDQEGATHGWHFDDPAFALILVLEAPPATEGGCLEYIDHHRAPDQRGGISRSGGLTAYLRDPLVEAAIMRRHHQAGDAYLLRADRCLHRVTPVNTSSRRAILNLAYEAHSATVYGNTASVLYDPPESRAA